MDGPVEHRYLPCSTHLAPLRLAEGKQGLQLDDYLVSKAFRRPGQDA
jgi:hypothetical protein